jgi:NAD(P)-dependent dehydrogenase (short-subunit alcohol dehydrogenase family)
MPETSFEGRKVVVFGGGGALGGGLVAAFTEAGATVVAADAHLPREDRRLAGTEYHAVDVTDDGSLAVFFDAQQPLWAVINTVGGFAPKRPLAALDPAELAGQLTLNLVSAALVTKHALRVLQPAGEGRIVHTASRAAVATKTNGFAYSVSKLGVMHLVTMAAEETRGTGITVNCVVPTIIDTPANRAALPDADHAAWPKVGDIARSYVFLAAPGSHLVSGAAIPV